MAVTVESKHDLPFDSTHFIAWSRNGKSAPAAGCFHRSWTVASSAGVKTSRSQWGVSYRFDCVVIYLGEWVNTLHSVNFTFHWCSPAPTLGLTLIFHCFPVVALFPCQCQINMLWEKKDVILGSLALFAQHILCALYGCTVFRQHCFLCSPNWNQETLTKKAVQAVFALPDREAAKKDALPET